MYAELEREMIPNHDEENTWFEAYDDAAPAVLSIRNISTNEFRTIMFALEAYKDSLRTTLKLYEMNQTTHPNHPNHKADKAVPTNIFGGPSFEDEMFCHEELSKVATIQFRLMEDHDLETREQIETWSQL